MGKWIALQVAGMVLVVVGAQGAIRILIHHANRGILSWVPGGFAGGLIVYVVVVVVGAVAATVGESRRRETS